MAKKYQDLGSYSDLVGAAKKSASLYGIAKPGKVSQKQVLELLAFQPGPDKAAQVKVEKTWSADGVDGQLITWSVGYGPRTEAWYLRPAGEKGKLPGVVALHDHGGFKYLGKEKIAFGPGAPSSIQTDWISRCYGARPWSNDLARLGFAVLVPDVFSWGSRKFDYKAIPEWDRSMGDAMHNIGPMQSNPPKVMPDDMSKFSWASVLHEHTIQKYCTVLGTTFAGVCAYEDRVAAAYLATRSDVQSGGVGCVGLSGGGLRSSLLQGTSKHIRAAVVVGLMSTYDGLLDKNVVSHTWMLYPTPNLARWGDWCDLTACRAPSPLLVQYDKEDALFTMEGMKAADKRLSQLYKLAGKPKNYEGQFYPGPHKFDAPMQKAAFAWLAKHLKK